MIQVVFRSIVMPCSHIEQYKPNYRRYAHVVKIMIMSVLK